MNFLSIVIHVTKKQAGNDVTTTNARLLGRETNLLFYIARLLTSSTFNQSQAGGGLLTSWLISFLLG